MSGFKFKPESILDFYMPGWGTATTQTMAISQFQNYLSHAGISPDEDGYLDTEQFLTTYAAGVTTSSQVASQYISEYSTNSTAALYKGYLYENYPELATIGYVVLPFKVNGQQVKVILPGTLCLCATKVLTISNSTTTKYRLVRDSAALNIYYNNDNTLYKSIPASTFDKGVVPFYLVFECNGGGGGGSSSEGLVAGRGGGGGGEAVGIVDLLEYGPVYITVGGGGFGGSHVSGDSSTASRHDGQAGGTTAITQRDGMTDLIVAYGGKGGIAADTTPSKATGGGGLVTSSVLPVYYLNNSKWISYDPVSGGAGLIDTGSAQTTASVKEFKTYKGAKFYLDAGGVSQTWKSGVSYSPGGGGGGAGTSGNGVAGGQGSNVGNNCTDSNGGGGGGGYLLGSYISGGAGGNGRVKIYC